MRFTAICQRTRGLFHRHRARRASVQPAGACAGSRLKRDFRSPAPSLAVFGLMARRSFSGSPIGGIAETQEILNFCGANNITADVEVIPIQKVNKAYERVL
jgi:D-arabinose 1-dehydrogenase-like Zn-dependent alcohol dehydrogenase